MVIFDSKLWVYQRVNAHALGQKWCFPAPPPAAIFGPQLVCVPPEGQFSENTLFFRGKMNENHDSPVDSLIMFMGCPIFRQTSKFFLGFHQAPVVVILGYFRIRRNPPVVGSMSFWKTRKKKTSRLQEPSTKLQNHRSTHPIPIPNGWVFSSFSHLPWNNRHQKT